MAEGDELDDEQCAMIGRIVVCVAAAESVVSKLCWHFAFKGGETLDPSKLHRRPMSEKLKALRDLVPHDGSRRDVQTNLIRYAFEQIDEDRHALVHGFPSSSMEGPLVLNLRQNHHVWVEDMPAVCAWARHLRNAAMQMYVDATMGIYDGDVSRWRPLPLPDPPPPIMRKAPLVLDRAT